MNQKTTVSHFEWLEDGWRDGCQERKQKGPNGLRDPPAVAELGVAGGGQAPARLQRGKEESEPQLACSHVSV